MVSVEPRQTLLQSHPKSDPSPGCPKVGTIRLHLASSNRSPQAPHPHPGWCRDQGAGLGQRTAPKPLFCPSLGEGHWGSETSLQTHLCAWRMVLMSLSGEGERGVNQTMHTSTEPVNGGSSLWSSLYPQHHLLCQELIFLFSPRNFSPSFKTQFRFPDQTRPEQVPSLRSPQPQATFTSVLI